MFLVILTTSWALIICPENCDDSTYTAVDDECDNCVNGFDAGSALTVSVVVAFMVSTFLNETSTRWWGIRKTTDRLFTEVFCCSLKLMCWIPKSSSRSLRFRDNLMRYANLGIELTILAARKSKLLVSMNIDDFLQRGLLNQVEADRMCNMELIEAIDYIYSLPLYQINHHGFQGCAIVPRHQLHELFFKQAEISRDLLMRILTPMPFPYAHLMAIIVKLHLLLVSAMAGTYVGRGFKQQQPGYVFWGYMILLFANIVFEGLLRLHVTLHNPFGDGVADLPVAMYLQENLKSTVGMLETEKNLPFQFTPYTKGKSERGEKKAGRKSSGEKRGEGGLSMSDIALLTSDDDLSDHQL